jgi:dihydrolipoamide dehydrogenase
VAVIEKESLGGVCLNWGYPNKSIIEISSGFNYLKHASDYGLTVSSFDKDFLQ